MAKINLVINDRKIETEPGKTILEVAGENRIKIPTLCHDPRLKPYGACRVCLVEVEGARTFLPACATEVIDGMVVKTNTVPLYEIRRTIVELLLSDHELSCVTCESAGQCQLQDLAYELGIEENRFEGEKHTYTIEDYNPLIERDLNKCISCGRCVRICEEVQQNSIYTFANRGFDAIVTTPYDRSLIETKCELCGQCVSTCPTGALTEKMSRYKGRIWEIEKVKTICPYCGCGCELEIQIKNGEIVRVSTDVESGINKGNACAKGRFGYDFVNHPNRLTSPLVRKNGELVETSWDEAIKTVADKFSKIKKKHGSDAIAGLSSAKCTNEENYLMQKFMRAVIGTNNIDHCARL